jgi:hypothetical protein
MHRTFLYRISRPADWSAPDADESGPRWELLDREGLGQLAELGPFDVTDGMRRFDRGDSCYVIRVDGRVAHYSWVQRANSHPITEAGVSVAVEPREIWIYNCRTAKWARGRGYYPATLRRIVREHFDAGFQAAWIYTASDNIASQSGIVRAGFDRVQTLTSLRAGSHYRRLGRRPGGDVRKRER